MMRWFCWAVCGACLALVPAESSPISPLGQAPQPSVRLLKEKQLLRAGGNAKSAAAVAAGLQWLALHQAQDGRWGLHDYHTVGKCNCSGAGRQYDTAGTAFGLLPFLSAGYTHQDAGQDNPYAKQVERGLKFLLENQNQEGQFGGMAAVQGLATQALCLAYHLTKDPQLKEPAQRAVRFICQAQGPDGGWRYRPREARSDTEQTGWQLQALRVAQLAGLEIPKDTWARVRLYLDRAASDEDGASYAYTTGGGTPAMTAVGLLGRQYLGWRPTYPGMKQGIDYLFKVPPAQDYKNLYYYYNATQVMRHAGGAAWAAWHPKMRDRLIEEQDQGNDKERPHQKGSWSPAGDAWGGQGGRIMQTSLALLTLEIYCSVDPPLADQPDPPPLTADEIQVLWDTAKTERVVEARQAMWALTESPQEVVPFFAERLQPATPTVDRERLARLVKELDADKFAVRQQASAELLKLGELAEPILRKELANKPAPEVRVRIEQILEEWERQPAAPEQLRLFQAIQALAVMRTPEARQLLEKLGKGTPEARLTRAARSALERLGNSPR